MTDVSSTTGASSSRLIDANSFRRDLTDRPKIKSIAAPPTAATPKHPAAVARRNARERNRVRQVNMGFVTLRNHIPQNGSKAKKLSKVETLRQAATYIQYLRDMLTVDESIGSGPFGGPVSCANSIANSDGSNFFYAATSPSIGTPSEAYYGAHPSPYSSNRFSEPVGAPHDQQQKSTPYGTMVHTKISPSSSTDSPQSSSFVSSASSELGGHGYECVTPPQLRSYNVQGDYLDQNQRTTPYHRLPHFQAPISTHSMQMYS